MCGRYSFTQLAETISEQFQVKQVPPLSPRYNIAPTQQVATVSVNSESSERQFKPLRWGLIPTWAKDPKIGAKLINARAETVAEKPSFR
jgi:putative SOS response-associated peptidase YedK